MATTSTRNSQIATIKIAAKQLGLDDATYRKMLQTVAGVCSAADLDWVGRQKVIDHLNRGRQQSTNEWDFVFSMVPDRRRYGKKIFRLAERVGKLMKPPVPVATKAYIEGITTQMRGTCSPLEFCDPEQLHKVVQVLEIYVKRHGV